MARQISSNNPFKGKPNVRAGAGTVRYTWNPPVNTAPGNSRNQNTTLSPCSGPYDNLVRYVFDVDLSNGNHLAYVDCDYVD
jgi:hypothetical protein|tara:strand:- start:2858 stop:3100 length:243 start_codon:yes stop_codon:yes gene_type:complete